MVAFNDGYYSFKNAFGLGKFSSEQEINKSKIIIPKNSLNMLSCYF